MPKGLFNHQSRLALMVGVVGVLCLGVRPGLAFAPEILGSVASVILVWQGQNRGESGKPWEEPEGTAVAIKPGGYLVTNYHVIRRAVSVSVRRADGQILPAEVIGGDPLTDLALIKVAEDLVVPPPAPEPELGAPVCTVGNQFGLGLSVTCGVVSAVHQTGIGFNAIEDFIQTDAEVNPGASGGALLDKEGRLVGVLSAIFTKDTDANLGVNFAASLRLVMRVVDDLIVHKRVVRGRSGLRVADVAEQHRGRRVAAATRQKTAPSELLTGIASKHSNQPGPAGAARSPRKD
jgi:S1-C subfamily serine protease